MLKGRLVAIFNLPSIVNGDVMAEFFRHHIAINLSINILSLYIKWYLSELMFTYCMKLRVFN